VVFCYQFYLHSYDGSPSPCLSVCPSLSGLTNEYLLHAVTGERGQRHDTGAAALCGGDEKLAGRILGKIDRPKPTTTSSF
jgi:hypothetical protein